jgi:hypothetical protein
MTHHLQDFTEQFQFSKIYLSYNIGTWLFDRISGNKPALRREKCFEEIEEGLYRDHKCLQHGVRLLSGYFQKARVHGAFGL